MTFILVLALSLIGLVRSESDGFSLKLLDSSSGALCLDGTPGGFYLKPSLTNSPNWLIHFQGDGWCVDEEDCLKRSRTDLGSSAKWPVQGVPDEGAHGSLSPDPAVNPTFYDWNMAFINYCDGASFAGFKKDPIVVQGENLYFRGAVILNEVFKSLLGLGLAKAENLVVGGTSAGGLAVYIHIDYIRTIIPKSVQVVGFPDSGVFLNMTASVTGGPSYTPHFENIFRMQNITSWTMNQGCFKEFASMPQKCFFAEYVLPYIETNLFMANALMDTWAFANILQLPCYLRDKNLNNCTSFELFHARSYESLMSMTFEPYYQIGSRHGCFLTVCVTHGGQDTDFMFSRVHIQSISMRQAFDNWFFKKGKFYTYDMMDFPWPNGCKSN
jgi:hypothetical protein